MGRVPSPGLGLSGEVTTEALEALLSGYHPDTGMLLGRELVDRVDKHGNTIRAVAGYDATLSAPKSLSVLWGLTGDERFAECHDVAVNATVAMIEKYASTTRVRSNGARLHPETGGLSMAVFRQSTSRADDPQLHTHVVISAKVQTRGWALVGVGCAGVEEASASLRLPVPIRASSRGHRTVRDGVRADRERPGRNRRPRRRSVGAVLETCGRDRSRDGRQARRVPHP